MARGAALAAALVVALLAVSGAGGSGAQTPPRGGTVVFGTLREPACLNAYFQRCHLGVPPATFIMRLALRGAFRVGPNLTARPDLVSHVDRTTRPPYTLTYHIRREARWSDGVRITARDFVFTHNTIRANEQELAEEDRVLVTIIRSAKAVDAKTVKITLRSRFAAWRGLFPHLLPAHALRGADFSSVWSNGIHNPNTGRPIGSGPFLVDRWERGRDVTFVRNPRYWGPRLAYLDRLVLRFFGTSGSPFSEQVERLRSGELDLVQSIGLSGSQVQELRRQAGVRVVWDQGPTWEHFDLRIGAGGSRLLERKLVRRALAFGIDRVGIARTLFGAIDARYPPSDSAIFLADDLHYRPNWRLYRHRLGEARRLLEQEGCRRGSDGIYACDGERLSLRFLTTAGAPNREQTLQLVQRQLRQVGIEVVPVYGPSLAVFNQILASGDFDVALFAWNRISVGAPGESAVLYGCGGVQNLSGYCQRLVTRDLDQARRILDPARQAEVLNRADAQLAKDVPVIPLVQTPLVAAHRVGLRNVVLKGVWDPFMNAEDWWLER